MQKTLNNLIIAVVVMGVIIVLLSTGVLDREKAAQERRYREELHQIELAALKEQASLDLRAKKEQTYLAIIRAQQLNPIQTVAVAMGLVAAGFAALGGSYYIVANLRKRSYLVWPNEAGIFPQIRIQVGETTLIHDANKTASAITAYTSTPNGSVLVVPIVPPGLEDATRQAVAQGAAVQLMRASVSGEGQSRKNAQIVAQRFLESSLPSPHLRVRVLSSQLPEIKGWIEEARKNDPTITK